MRWRCWCCSRLLEEELLYEEAEVMQRLRHWTKGRLQEEVRRRTRRRGLAREGGGLAHDDVLRSAPRCHLLKMLAALGGVCVQGLSLFGVVARPRGRLYKEHIIRFTLPSKGGNSNSNRAAKPSPFPNKKRGGGGGYSSSSSSSATARAPPLPYHRLGPGDIIAITPERAHPLNYPEVIEGLVLERGSWFVDVVVKDLPPGMAWKRNDPNAG